MTVSKEPIVGLKIHCCEQLGESKVLVHELFGVFMKVCLGFRINQGNCTFIIVSRS